MSFTPLKFVAHLCQGGIYQVNADTPHDYEQLLSAFVGEAPYIAVLQENGCGEIAYKCNINLVEISPQEGPMDKQIKKIKKSLDKGEKDTKKLLVMDKKYDKELDKCHEMKGSAKKKR
jgi:hypothetical protein